MWAKGFFYACVAVLLLIMGKWVVLHPYFRIASVSIVAEDGSDSLAHADKIAIFEAVRPVLTGSFFQVDTQEARKRAQAQPWVRQAKVDRIAPNGIRIEIEEHQAAARWMREGFEAGLIAPDGSIFQAASAQKLPELDGDYGTHIMMLEQLAVFSAKLKPLRLQIKRLQYSPRAAWSVYLDNGIEIRLGKDKVHARLDRFIRLYPAEWAAHAAAIEYVDMRYRDGAAVGWKEGQRPSFSPSTEPMP